MSPIEARRAVGHPDIVERDELVKLLRESAEELGAAVCENEDLAAEIERLRTALRAVRACTDPAWVEWLIADALREDEP